MFSRVSYVALSLLGVGCLGLGGGAHGRVVRVSADATTAVLGSALQLDQEYIEKTKTVLVRGLRCVWAVGQKTIVCSNVLLALV